MDELGNLQMHKIEDVLVDQVGFGERDDAARNAEQAADFEMLASLRLDGLVGGDDEQQQIDATCSGQHILDEALMPGDIDKAKIAEVREAQVDGNAAALFLFETIGINAGECADQRRLAVVDVSGGAHDDPSVERNGGDLLLRVYRPLMNMNERELIEAAVGAAYEVSNTLGCGFLEKVYERAMIRELTSRGLSVRGQVSYAVLSKGFCVGEYFADLVVENQLVIELKCVDRFSKEHLAQCLNYLKASGLESALLVNFQRPKVEWRRVVSRF